MSELSPRTDITERIRGEIRENAIILTLHGQAIGHIPFDATCVHMDQGYQVDDQRIFRVEDASIPQPAQYVDCEENGWC
ncbi:DUF2553 family protein [Ammoniphilus sp. CFH 90114]|uniref:DUF2553 family protein n=1 Tax=Ammoniphilus sp. CFH 90114 TaxID=2493665 RepID=UPI00100E1C64|nr:DUF2553 family protein [Ammoniphilus sp. CFH 90114]RXT05712.1 DUF2553 family protein [Ammoniphilus sp. CFH 90114]